jgi:hypothetical protein
MGGERSRAAELGRHIKRKTQPAKLMLPVRRKFGHNMISYLAIKTLK